MSRTLITAVELGCADEIITIIAMLSVPSIFYRPKEKATQADQKKAAFHQPEGLLMLALLSRVCADRFPFSGDHLMLLAVFQSWKQNRFSMPWASENFLQGRALKQALDIRKQLLGLMDRFKLPVDSCGRNYNLIRRSLVSGFFRNVAKKDPTGGYRTLVENQNVYIYPGSCVFQKK